MAISNRPTCPELSTSTRGSFWTSRIPSRRVTQPIISGPPVTDLRRSQTLRVLSLNPPSTYFRQTVSAYDLPWPKLRRWLVAHFSNEPTLEATLIEKQEGVDEMFYFYVPRKLTNEEIAEIYHLRTRNDEKTDRSKHRCYTPDPDPDHDDDPA